MPGKAKDSDVKREADIKLTALAALNFHPTF